MDIQIRDYFAQTSDIAALCTQNGWPDNDSLRVEIIERTEKWARCAVGFDEILTEGAGCVAGRVRCWGRFRVELDAAGHVVTAKREM